MLTGLKPACTESYDPISPCLCESDIYQEETDRFNYCIPTEAKGVDELIECLEEIKLILTEPQPIDIGVTETPWCTPDCEPLFLCKIIDEVTEEITWGFHVAVPGESQLQPYDGERRLCVECNQTPKTGFNIGSC